MIINEMFNATEWGDRYFALTFRYSFDIHTLKTLFNIVEERLKKLLNFDVIAV